MTAKGKVFLTLIILGVLGFGVWKWLPKLKTEAPGAPTTSQTSDPGQARTETAAATAQAAELAETQTEVPKLATPGAYQPKDNTVEIELSEYPGYAGLIVANGGLAPNDNSLFFKKHGFKVA